MALMWIAFGLSCCAQSIDSRWRLLPDSTVAGVTYHELKLAAALRIASDETRRDAARRLVRAMNAVEYMRYGAISDSTAIANCMKDAQAGWNEANNWKEESMYCYGQLKEARRITVGGWVVRVGIVALALKGGHALYQELNP